MKTPMKMAVLRRPRRIAQTMRSILYTLCFFTLATSTAQAGLLRIGDPEVEDGIYTFPIILLEDGGKVAAANFRVHFDPAVFEPLAAVAGAAAVRANKAVTGNVPLPGEYIIVMMGLNATTVSSGDLAHVQLRLIGGTESGETDILLSDTTLATLEGTELPSQSLGNRIRLGPAPENIEEDGPEPEPQDDSKPPTSSDESREDTPHFDAPRAIAQNAASPSQPQALPDFPPGTRTIPPASGGKKVNRDSSRKRVDKLASDAAKLRQEVRTPKQAVVAETGSPQSPLGDLQSDTFSLRESARAEVKETYVSALAGTTTVERQRGGSTRADQATTPATPRSEELSSPSRVWVGTAAALILMGLAVGLFLRWKFLH